MNNDKFSWDWVRPLFVTLSIYAIIAAVLESMI